MTGAKKRARAHGSPAAAPAARPVPAGPQEPRPVTLGRVALLLGLLLAGALVGIAGALVIEAWFPAGLVLALLAAAGCFLGGRIAARGALGVAAPAVGWLAVFMWLSGPRPEGDAVFVAGISTYVYMLGGIVAAVICATLQLPAARPVSAAPRSG
ncbi:DUF6113 family protein [Streptomyces sp. NPDC089919]|uniref:DUF6113 family protein n=1 Tax=Streptomyces sp. NPDC089919 TaxID=3155188 RepID=UPI0034496C96